MTPEDRVKNFIGDLVLQNSVLAAKVDELTKQLSEKSEDKEQTE